MSNHNGNGAPDNSWHVLSVLVENHFGVLARISAMFAARSFNIDSLTVGPTHDPTCSRMTVTVRGESRIVDQIRRQLEKFVEVIRVEDLTEAGPFVARELVLVKVSITQDSVTELVDLVNSFQPQIVDMTLESVTLQVVATPERVDEFLALLESHGLREVARTGAVALMRGAWGLHQAALAE
ncbi:MAG: acetolactate synthase small subunit [Candidatus Sumerlaeia bacterium]|nr:acetolactate synthase small subunit [Candidatus Sumerlaeia bacterium]